MKIAHVYQDAKGEWRWRMENTRNNKVVADSGEGYASKSNAVRALKGNFSDAYVFVVITSDSAGAIFRMSAGR